jgi:uncharacterized membrane protein
MGSIIGANIDTKQLFVIATIGLCASIYGFYVEMRKEEDGAYAALCDINPMYSCTKILNSEYGRLLRLFRIVEIGSVFDVPNTIGGILLRSQPDIFRPHVLLLNILFCLFVCLFAFRVVGVVYYVVMMLGSFTANSYILVRGVLLTAATLGVLLSAYLAWVMAYKLAGIVCVICLLSYVCNIALFLLVVRPMIREAWIGETSNDVSADSRVGGGSKSKKKKVS